MKGISRRQFGVSTAAVAAAAMGGLSVPEVAPAEVQAAPRSFSKGFVWGCATASYQIEGAAYTAEQQLQGNCQYIRKEVRAAYGG
jgi:beta-glucosidase